MPETKVPLRVGERDLFLRFSLGALAEAQRAGGFATLADLLKAYDVLVRSFTAVGRADPDDPEAKPDLYAFYEFDLSALRALLWGGTLAAQDGAGGRDTPEALLDRVEFSSIGDVMLAVTQAMSRAFRGPQTDKAEADAGKAATDPPASDLPMAGPA